MYLLCGFVRSLPKAVDESGVLVAEDREPFLQPAAEHVEVVDLEVIDHQVALVLLLEPSEVEHKCTD